MLSRWEPQIYAIFRLVTGFVFFSHGTSKLLGWPPSGMPGKLAVGSLLWFSGIIELIGGFLIMIGLFASIAAFICSGEMALAYFMAHQPHGLHPLTNKGEPAVLYCFLFLYIAAHGSGIWSVDSALNRNRR
ncbi:MAG: DoxX family protein [Thermoanaerobaculia bacterium]